MNVIFNVPDAGGRYFSINACARLQFMAMVYFGASKLGAGIIRVGPVYPRYSGKLYSG